MIYFVRAVVRLTAYQARYLCIINKIQRHVFLFATLVTITMITYNTLLYPYRMHISIEFFMQYVNQSIQANISKRMLEL